MRSASIPERNIQIELYRHLKNVIEKQFSFDDVKFTDVKFEAPNIDGRPDLVVYAVEKGRARPFPLLVIETKRKVPYLQRRFDPFSRDVIAQAERYATWLGAPFFATCNGELFVVFETFKEGVPLPERRLRHYKVPWPIDENFARFVLEEIGKFRVGVGKWLPLDDVFVERLRAFHRFITPFVYQALINKLREDSSFKERYIQWLRSQLFEFSDEMNERMAEQAAYLLMNKIMFYKTLETQISGLPKLEPIKTEKPEEFASILREFFDYILKNVDYEAIFQKSIFDEIPFPRKLCEALNEFIEELGTYHLAQIQSDVLGRVYEELIPADERHRLGQYYTPPPIVELIVNMCVRSPNDKVLDPGCGSGSFLVKAYHRLKELKKKENPLKSDEELHREILDQLYGIDINPFPAQLSSINLAVRNLRVRSRNINLIISDFFKIQPGTSLLPKEFDAVVTNPPYTRQEEMEYKDQIREAALTYTDGTKIPLDARAGIYAYFFIHSAKFLKNGGRMGYITSDTWLDVGFGKDLKKFFLDHFKILCIIWYSVRAFERPLVGTCISIFEKEDTSEDIRKDNIVKFVRIKRPMDADKIIKTLENTLENYEDDNIAIITKQQAELRAEEKWGRYLRAPAICFKIINHPKMVELHKLCDIRRGITSGANDFFYLDREKIKQWNLEQEFLKPVIVSPKNVSLEITPSDITHWVLMVHDSKEKLAKKAPNVLKYIEWGENLEIRIKGGKKAGQIVKGIHNLSTVKSRRIWYDLGQRKPAPILRTRRIWERCIYALNQAKAFVNDSFYELYPKKEENTMVLAGILNSTVTALLSELYGRFYGGGVLELEVYESKKLPVLDPDKLSLDEKERIQKAFRKLCEAQKRNGKRIEQAQRELDNVIFDILGLTSKEREQVYEGLKTLREMRLQRKEVKVLVETEEKWAPRRKRATKEKPPEPIKRLDSWLD